MRLYGTFAKIDKEQRLVFGYASTEAVDAHGETVLKSAVEEALDGYLTYSNVREMHQLSAVGKTVEAEVDDKGLYIGAKIVDDTAWKKVTEGVYAGFSIGGKVLGRDPKNKKVITKVRLDEISLVDRPSNPEARFDLWRAAGATDPLARATQALQDADSKIASSGSGTDLILKVIAAKDAEIDQLRKRIDELLEQSLPAKTASQYALIAVSKEQDVAGNGAIGKAGPSGDDLVAALQAMDPDERAMLLTKAALQLPRPATMVAGR